MDCKAYYDAGDRCSGVYTIKPDYLPAFDVCSTFNVMNNKILSSGHIYCDMDTDGGGWTVLQRRMDGTVNFNRDWADYNKGFGDLDGEHWLGLNKIYQITHKSSNEILRILMTIGAMPNTPALTWMIRKQTINCQ